MGAVIVVVGMFLMILAFDSGYPGLGVFIGLVTVPLAILIEAYIEYGDK